MANRGSQVPNLPVQQSAAEQDKRDPTPPDPEIIDRFLQVQMEEIAVRKVELDLQKDEIARSYDHARSVLDAQFSDRAAQRSHGVSVLKIVLAGAFAILLIGSVFTAYLLHLGKDEVAIEIIRMVGYGLFGGLGGYGLSEHKRRKDAERPQQD